MNRRRKHLAPGDVFLVPLAPDCYGVGQIVDVVDDLGIACVFFDDLLAASPDCGQAVLRVPIGFAVTFPHEIKRGLWKSCPARQLPARSSPWPHERFRARGWIGLSILEGGLIADYLAARLGVLPPKAYQQEPGYEARFALGMRE